MKSVISILFLTFLVNAKTLVISPGHVGFFEIKNSSNLKQGAYLLCEDQVHFPLITEEKISGYLAESYFSKRDRAFCQVYNEFGNPVNLSLNLKIQPFKYRKEYLKVDKKKVHPSKSNQIRIKEEKNLLESIYEFSESEYLFKEPFSRPLKSKVTSSFGKKRIFNRTHQTQHLGTDFRAALGKNIPVANTGRVVLVKDLFYSGKTVIVDHGKGIFTLYGHLSKVHVEEGQLIRKFHIVGESGSTGRSTAPHLHWGAIINAHLVDGMTLIKASERHFR